MFRHRRQEGCGKIRSLLSQFIDQQLNAVESDAVRFHVEVCEACRRELQTLQATTKLLRRMPAASVPRSFTLAEAPARRRAFTFNIPQPAWLQTAAVAALILLVAMVSIHVTGTFGDSEPLLVSEGPGETSAPQASPSPTDSLLPPTPTLEGQEMTNYDTPPPAPSDGPYIASDDAGGGAAGGEENAATWEAQDPGDGGGKGSSPASSPTPPSWVLALEILAGVSLAVFGGWSLFLRQRRRAASRS